MVGIVKKGSVNAVSGEAELESTDSDSHFSSMLESAPFNVMYCDLDLVITYINPQSITTLKKLEQHLPIRVEQILGSKIDVFHKIPAHQRKLLSDDRNLPLRSTIDVGPEKLDLWVAPIYDEAKKYKGALVTWDIVTKRIENEKKVAMIQSMVEAAPVNILMADRDLKLTFMNPASIRTLRTIEKLLPKPVDQLMGQSIDIFHKVPEVQRRLLADDRNLPHRAKIRLGAETLDLLVSAIYDDKKAYIGPMVTWSVITQKENLIIALEETASSLAAASSELSATARQMEGACGRSNVETGTAASSSQEISRGVQIVATNMEEMGASIKEIARSSSEAANMANEALSRAHETNATITQLGISSQEIGNVIKVISSIAQQTNLLALNATIEAARAGDAGRGFAVVANEVKELAKQTAKATEDITNKIGALQKDSGAAVEAIGSIGQNIEKLNRIATSIAAAVEEQNATTNEVARVVQDSARGVVSIAETVKNLSKSAAETSNGASQTLEAATSLAVIAEKLRTLVTTIRD